MNPGASLIECVAGYAGASAEPRLSQALALAEQAHAGKVCEGERPYLAHVIAVAEWLSQWQAPVEVIIAGLLHDATDRRYATKPAGDAVRRAFGDTIADRIQSVVQLSRVELPDAAQESDNLLPDPAMEVTQLPAITRVLHLDPIAAVIKIADRIEKLTSRCALPADQERNYVLGTMGTFVPIANRLGMWSAKRELEDGAFGLLHPEAFEEMQRGYGTSQRQDAARGLLDEANRHLARAGVPAEAILLPVSLYSLHRKLSQAEKAIPPELLTPLLILVDSTEACYAAMQTMHQHWRPLTGQVWDYIASPKSNRYRAIHTRLRSDLGAPLVTVIRTHQGHLVAERGITAAWAGVPAALLPTPPEWSDPPPHRIAVFTPNGDLKELPREAIAVDLAYAVHPQVGHQCVSAIVNGDPASPERVLHTGDVVEIVTNEASTGPRDDWLDKVKSGKARREIRRWLVSQRQEGVAQQGWSLLDTKLREIGVTLTAAETAGRVRDVATELGYSTASELQIALGLGRLTPATVVARMQQAAQDRGTPIPRAIGVPLIFAHLPRRLAKCCHPLAPDPIVGYVTQDGEVVVHRANCHTIRRLKPLLSVEWQTRPWQDTAQICISAEDRAGLVRDVAAAVTDSGIAMSHFHADRQEDGSARIILDLDTNTAQQTRQLVDRLRAMESVRHFDWGRDAPVKLPEPANYFEIPYTLSPVIGRRFFGRKTEFLKLDDYLHDPTPGKAILLWGPRRIGKTSLLRNLEQRLAHENLYLPVFVDMQSISGQDTAVFLHTIARLLAVAVAHRNVNVPKFNRMRRDPLSYFRVFVDSLRGVESRHIVLILDEMQVLTGLKEEHATLADSFAYLRSLITGGGQISFLFSGGGILDTLRQQVGASSLLNVTHTQKVDCLPREEARRLIVEPAQHLSYDDNVVDELLSLTAGHPYYLHLLCGELALNAYSSGGTRISQAHLDDVLADWLPAQEEHHFNHLWGTDSPIEHRFQQQYKLFLTAVATVPARPDDWVSFESLCTALEPAPYPEQELWQGLQALSKMDTLDMNGDTHYRVKVPLCQQWMRANYSVAKMLREIS